MTSIFLGYFLIWGISFKSYFIYKEVQQIVKFYVTFLMKYGIKNLKFIFRLLLQSFTLNNVILLYILHRRINLFQIKELLSIIIPFSPSKSLNFEPNLQLVQDSFPLMNHTLSCVQSPEKNISLKYQIKLLNELYILSG